MIGKVQQDSFQGLRIRLPEEYEPSQFSFGSNVSNSPGESLLPRDCQESMASQSAGLQIQQNNTGNQQQQSSRYKTEMCRPYQEHGVCKYGEKCQFAHGHEELRNVNRHPKYKTDMCRTYHSVGFCPYGPRCHFIHSLEEIRPMPTTPEKKSNNGIKQLPMFGGGSNSTWTYNAESTSKDMKLAVDQLTTYFNMAGGRNMLNSSGSSDSSRSGSFCSDLDSPTSQSPSPDVHSSSPTRSSGGLRLPIFSRLA